MRSTPEQVRGKQTTAMRRALLSCLLLLGLSCHGTMARPGRSSIELLTSSAPSPSSPELIPSGGTHGPVRIHWRRDINRTDRNPSLVPGIITNSKLEQDGIALAAAPGQAPKPRAESIQWPGLGGYGAGKVEYHGGPLMTDTITVHVIYYGNWPESSGQSVLEGFVNSLSSAEADNKVRPYLRSHLIPCSPLSASLVRRPSPSQGKTILPQHRTIQEALALSMLSSCYACLFLLMPVIMTGLK